MASWCRKDRVWLKLKHPQRFWKRSSGVVGLTCLALGWLCINGVMPQSTPIVSQFPGRLLYRGGWRQRAIALRDDTVVELSAADPREDEWSRGLRGVCAFGMQEHWRWPTFSFFGLSITQLADFSSWWSRLSQRDRTLVWGSHMSISVLLYTSLWRPNIAL